MFGNTLPLSCKGEVGDALPGKCVCNCTEPSLLRIGRGDVNPHKPLQVLFEFDTLPLA
jgi:uncharacterized RmlC-like cupin family protein